MACPLRALGIQSDEALLPINLPPFDGKQSTQTYAREIGRHDQGPEIFGQGVAKLGILLIGKQALADVRLGHYREVRTGGHFGRGALAPAMESGPKNGKLAVRCSHAPSLVGAFLPELLQFFGRQFGGADVSEKRSDRHLGHQLPNPSSRRLDVGLSVFEQVVE